MQKRDSKAAQLQRYKHRLKFAQKWRDEEGYDATWKRMVDLYKGKHFPILGTAEDQIAVNVAFGTINVIYPSISVNYPKITVNANKYSAIESAETTEAVVNYFWRHHDFHKPFRRATKDFLVIGHGWLKVGWRFVEESRPLSDDEYAEVFAEKVAEADEFAAANPDLANELPTDEEIAANLVDTREVVVEDRPFVERISGHDMFVDPEAVDVDDAAWIAQRFRKPVDEVKKDKRFKASARKRVEADMVLRPERDRATKKGDQHDDDKRVTIWEFYNLAESKFCVFAEGSDEYLVDPVDFPYEFGHPFVFVGNYDIPDQFYPLGDLESIEPLQHELNKTRSQMMQARKKFSRKYLYRESSFDQHGIEGLQSDEDNTMVPVADESAPLSETVVPLAQVPLPPEIYNHSQIVEGDIATVSGVSEYQRGQVPETRRTATEAAIISDAVNARAADKLALIERAIGEVARKVVQACQQFVTGDQVARIVGEDGVTTWVDWDRESIVGEFDFEVEAGSTQPMNETARRQQATAMMQALGPLIGLVIDPHAIAVHMLQQGFGVKDASQFLMEMPPPEPVGGEPEDPNAVPAGGGTAGGPQPVQPGGGEMESGDPEALAALAQLSGQVGLNL